MKTKNIEIKTKVNFLSRIKEATKAPSPIVALATDYPNSYQIPFHKHDRSQLVYASSGVMTVTTEKGIWVVPPLRAVWVPAHTGHQIGCSGNLAMRSLFIKPEVVSKLPEECCVVSVPPVLRELILHAVALPRLYEPNSPAERIMNVILDLVQTLKIAPLDLPIPTDHRLKKISDALTLDPGDNCTLEDWGKSVGATSRTLARLFKLETGIGFRQWRQQMRILESLRRLGREDQVTTIALDLGYDSPSAFIAMFKKTLGKTPGQYFKEADS